MSQTLTSTKSCQRGLHGGVGPGGELGGKLAEALGGGLGVGAVLGGGLALDAQAIALQARVAANHAAPRGDGEAGLAAARRVLAVPPVALEAERLRLRVRADVGGLGQLTLAPYHEVALDEALAAGDERRPRALLEDAGCRQLRTECRRGFCIITAG